MAICGVLPRNVRVTITRLCLFFNVICGKVTDLGNLDELEHEATIILCKLEMFFPPSFFDILVREIIIGGPDYLSWMYLVERYMKTFKGYTKSHHLPKALIVERISHERLLNFVQTICQI